LTYSFHETIHSSSPSGKFQKPKYMNRVSEKYFFLVGVWALMLFSSGINAQKKYTLSGHLKNAGNGEDMVGATVYVVELNSGTAANVYGFYSLTLEEGTYTIRFQSIGFQSLEQKVVLNKNTTLDLELAENAEALKELVVEGEKKDVNVSGMQMSVQKMDMKTIQKMPAFMGEADVVKSIQQLPGISTVGEGASGFNVRGGGVGQNLVLLDEAPVYNSSHLLGFFSVFNPDAVKDVTLIKGGIPANYGGRIASILDVRMKEGNSKELTAQGGVGSVFSRLAIEGPIVKDKSSFIIAGRRSYADILARPFVDILQDGGALNFYDLTVKTNYVVNNNNRLFLSAYLGRDNFKFDERQGFNWGNQTATLRWNHLFNERLFSNFTLLYSNYDYELAFGEDDLDKFEWNSQIKTFDLKPEFTYFLNPKNKIIFGGEALFYEFEPANAVGVSNGERSVISLDNKRALEASIYLGNEQELTTRLSAQYGLRYSNYVLLGAPTTYYLYDNSTEAGKRKEVTETKVADDFESIQTYDNFEPRVSIKYQLNERNSIKTSYNRTVQYVHLVSNTTASNPLDVWTPSTNNIKPQRGQQIALGWFKNFGKVQQFEGAAEIYYRKTTDQIDYIDGADLLINEFIEGDLLSGKGRAYGFELYLKKNAGKLNGWISYTLARTELQVDGINNGDWYPTRYDQLHGISITSIYELNNRWAFSANFTYKSGTPTTFPNGRYQIQGYTVPYIDGNSRNNFRIPSYHRLDLSATLYGKKERKGKIRKNEDFWVFSIYNVYNRRNPFSIYFAQQDERVVNGALTETLAKQVSIIGSLIPAVSYNFKF
jgi:hypothetical protein